MASSQPEGDNGKVSTDATEITVSYSGSVDEMYGITADMIRKHKELLQDRLQDTEFGILGKLVTTGRLTYQETAVIEHCSTNPYDRSKKLIDVVLEKNVVSEFIKVLVDTNQKHLVNYLRGDGAYNAEFGEDWPLGDDRIKQLNVNQEHLIDIIEPCDSGLIGILFSAKVINDRQFRSLSQGKNPIKKNKALLNIMRRQSVKDYNSTIGCLINSNQAHIAKILQETGVVLRIRVSQEGDPQAVNQTEDAISDQFAKLLRNYPIEEAHRILEMTQLKVIAATKGESIYLYVYCATLEELTELHNLLITGAVKTIVETLFNKFVSHQDRIVVSYTYSEEEYVKCKSYFEEIGSSNSESLAASEDNATARAEFQTLSLVQGAKMEDRYRRKLQQNRLAILENLDVLLILDYLFQEKVLSDDDLERIRVKETRSDRCRFLLDMLPSKGPKAFRCFVRALEKDYLWLANQLKK